jgi:tRNA threonylcarbamoyladenosine biosynthesis protein TsaE
MHALVLATSSPEETRMAGRAVASLLEAGDVVSLTGDLGAGKTAFVQGAAAGLGVEGPVQSPTFVLIRQYQGRLPVAHVDVYRLDRLQDAADLGLDELVEGEGVVFVEWGDGISALLPGDHLRVELDLGEDGDQDRRIVVAGSGTRWARRWERLAAALASWTEGGGPGS